MTMHRTLAAVVALTAALVATPPHADAYSCRRVANVKLQPTPEGRALGVRGRASLEECFGVTFLRVVVTGAVPDGTGFTPAVVQGEPLLGDTFYATRRRAETGWQVPLTPGTEVTVFDDTFTPVLTGTL